MVRFSNMSIITTVEEIFVENYKWSGPADSEFQFPESFPGKLPSIPGKLPEGKRNFRDPSLKLKFLLR